MASCMMIAKAVGVRPYTKKDGSPAYTLSVAMENGGTVELYGSGSCPIFPFGTDVTVSFDLNIFNGKVNGVRLESVKEYKK